jgi:hypothetical protein
MTDAMEQYVIAAARERLAAGPDFLEAKAQCDEAAKRLLADPPKRVREIEALTHEREMIGRLSLVTRSDGPPEAA